jgi:hypothetical protein
MVRGDVTGGLTMLPAPAGYPSPTTRLPHDLVIRFWDEVYAQLQTVHGLTAAEAFASIVECRAETDHLVGDMIYHRGPEDLAESIAVGWRNGALKYPLATAATPAAPASPSHPATTTP